MFLRRLFSTLKQLWRQLLNFPAYLKNQKIAIIFRWFQKSWSDWHHCHFIPLYYQLHQSLRQQFPFNFCPKLDFKLTYFLNESLVWLRIKKNTKMCDCLTLDCSRIRICCIVFAMYDGLDIMIHFYVFRHVWRWVMCIAWRQVSRDDFAIKNYDTFPCYCSVFIYYKYSAFIFFNLHFCDPSEKWKNFHFLWLFLCLYDLLPE